ncbi:hypothetical protein GW17_00041455, partial [Ensete ventricosum]
VLKQVVERGKEVTMSLEGLGYLKTKCRLEWRWTQRSARCRRGRSTDYEERDADARQRIVVMGMTTPWYYRGGTSVESSIPCSNGRRALV